MRTFAEDVIDEQHMAESYFSKEKPTKSHCLESALQVSLTVQVCGMQVTTQEGLYRRICRSNIQG